MLAVIAKGQAQNEGVEIAQRSAGHVLTEARQVIQHGQGQVQVHQGVQMSPAKGPMPHMFVEIAQSFVFSRMRAEDRGDESA